MILGVLLLLLLSTVLQIFSRLSAEGIHYIHVCTIKCEIIKQNFDIFISLHSVIIKQCYLCDEVKKFNQKATSESFHTYINM